MSKNVGISELRRQDKVRFTYEGRGRLLDVEGRVDKISKSEIYVGNEYWQNVDCLEIFHTSRYKIKKIQNLTKI